MSGESQRPKTITFLITFLRAKRQDIQHKRIIGKEKEEFSPQLEEFYYLDYG